MTLQVSRSPAQQAPSPLLRETVGSIAVLTLDSPATRNALSDAMIAALKSGHIRHAGLDVFNTEPLRPTTR